MITVRNRFLPESRPQGSHIKGHEKRFQNFKKAMNRVTSTVTVVGAVCILALTVSVTTILIQSNSLSQEEPIKDSVANSIKELVNTSNLRTVLHALTEKAHVAGTENNLKVAEFIRKQMIQQGLENVHFNEYNVLLSYPNWTSPNNLEIIEEDGTVRYKTLGRSPAIIKEEQNDPFAEIQWLAYSAAGVVEGDIVYVNKATPKDLDHLESIGTDLSGKIWLARYSGNFRGNIAKLAVQKNAKGCIIYSDPEQYASLGTEPEKVFGNTDKMPPHAVQRGTVFMGFGDPRTPAFPSIGNLHREKSEEELFNEKKLPNIPMMPISYADAQILFENIQGHPVIPSFQGRLNVTYRYGPGFKNNQKLRMTVHAKNEERKIQNVLGYIKGVEEPEKFVLVGNHYDAWTYGAIDPNSGTTALLEVSRAIKEYQNKTGWAPARSILFAHWDAEEYGLIGSTEFTEEFRVQLMRRAVAVINMDVIGGNQTLLGVTNPTLANVLRDAATNVEQPNKYEVSRGRTTLYDSWKHFAPSKNNRSSHPYQRILAGGSDHLPFFDYLGIPVILFITTSLDTPPAYPLYHTIYETPYLTEKIMDPEYKMHKAVAQMFIELTLKLTESKILPYDLKELVDDTMFDYLPSIENHFQVINRFENLTEYLQPGIKQFELLQQTVQELSEIVYSRDLYKLENLPFAARVDENNRLIEFEKCFINPQGTSENPQARHLLFHPSSDDWYNGAAISQVHNLISKIESSLNEDDAKKYSQQLAKEVALVNFAFICAKHSLSNFFTL